METQQAHEPTICPVCNEPGEHQACMVVEGLQAMIEELKKRPLPGLRVIDKEST